MTTRAQVVIDDHTYLIPGERDVGEVIDEILDAVRSGGRFLTFGTPDTAVDVLVSPGTAVRIERTDAAASERNRSTTPAETFDEPELWV